MPNHVFVYGTLTRGDYNNDLLRNEEFVTIASTLRNEYVMFGGSFPYAVPKRFVKGEIKTLPIMGEVWTLNQPSTIKLLDCLEGYQEGRDYNHYERNVIKALGNDTNVYECYIYERHYDVDEPNNICPVVYGHYKWRG